MKFLIDNIVSIILILILIGVIVRYSIRTYYIEKRRHLTMMMRGTEDNSFLKDDKEN